MDSQPCSTGSGRGASPGNGGVWFGADGVRDGVMSLSRGLRSGNRLPKLSRSPDKQVRPIPAFGRRSERIVSSF